MTTHYLDLDYSTLNFYEYSKTAKEGFEIHGEGTDKVSYRRMYTKGVFGVFQSISLKTSDWGDKITVRVLEGEKVFVMSFPLYTQKGQIDNRYAEPLICTLPNLSKGMALRFYPYSIDKTFEDTDKTVTFHGVSIKLANLDDYTVSDKVEAKYTRVKRGATATDANIPPLTFVEKLGKFKPTAVSIEAREDFLADLLEAELDRIGYKPNVNSGTQGITTNHQPTNKTTAAVTPGVTQTKVDPLEVDDDLPF